MDWQYLFTSFEGRINRGKFWAGVGIFIAIGILAAIIDMLLGTTIDLGGGAQLGIIGLLVSLGTIYFALALYAKRWHDRDKSGWWSAILIGVAVVGALLVFVAPAIALIANLIVLAVGIWFIVELGILKGTTGANQYGPDPLA